MNDAPRYDSTASNGKSGTTALLRVTPTTPCCVCFNTAQLDDDWIPGSGLAQELRLYICNAGHLTYKACPRLRT